jgi:hypothetical protein
MKKKSNTSIYRRLISVGVLCIALFFLSGCSEGKRTEGLDGQTVTTADGRKWLLRSKGLHNYGIYPVTESGKVLFSVMPNAQCPATEQGEVGSD